MQVDYLLASTEFSGLQKWLTGWLQEVSCHVDARAIVLGKGRIASHFPVLRQAELWLRRRPGAILHIPTQMHAQWLGKLTARKGPVVITCHDVIPLLPEAAALAGISFGEELRHRMALGLRLADKLICVSEFSAADLARVVPIDPTRIMVVPMGVDIARYSPSKRDKRLLERHGINVGWPVVLYVGSEAPRKNLKGIIDALALLRQRQIPFTFVKVGARRPGFDYQRYAWEMGIGEWAYFVDYVPESELPSWFASADIFVFPSRYEGFGLPVLEAMASGCPVVASNVTSIPEVAGNAAKLVAPDDIEGIARGIQNLLFDCSLRQCLIEAGLARAAAFTWEKTAQGVLRAYKEVSVG